MKIYIGCDHAAIDMKNEISEYLREKSYTVEDLGINTGEKIDYPISAERVARKVVSDKNSLGILICGTGIGMSIAAKKVKFIVNFPINFKILNCLSDFFRKSCKICGFE